jgi:anti-anti-sigma factor
MNHDIAIEPGLLGARRCSPQSSAANSARRAPSTLRTGPAIQQNRPHSFTDGQIGGNLPKMFALSIANPHTGPTGDGSAEAVRLLAEINEHTVLINLKEMDRPDSWAIALLIEAMQRIKAHGGSLVLFGIRDNVRRFFETTQLDQVFRIFATRGEALADQGRLSLP